MYLSDMTFSHQMGEFCHFFPPFLVFNCFFYQVFFISKNVLFLFFSFLNQCCIPKKFGDSPEGLVYFLQYQQNYVDLYCFAHFQPLLFSCIRCYYEQNTRKPIVYLRNLSDNNNFVFPFFIFGDIFWAPITFERYHFQSGYNL